MHIRCSHSCSRAPQGFSLIEIVVALLVLAVCLVPAANALRAGLATPTIADEASQRLGCVKATMEAMLAEPYPKLFAAALASTQATAYSTVAADCPAINVYITSYNPATSPYYFPGTDTDLLYVRVRLADATLTSAAAYTLITLVAH